MTSADQFAGFWGGLRVVLLAGLACGVLDISCTLILSRRKRIGPKRLFQGIAGGLLGPAAFVGGRGTAMFGLALLFLIATIAAAVYYVISREVDFLNGHAVLSGLIYGIFVHLIMSLVVLPLSSLRRPLSVKAFGTQLVVHMFFVGLPIALVVDHFS